MKNLNGIIISSGLSSRMGDFKPLLNYQDVPFFINILVKLLHICDEVNLIVGHQKEKIIDVFNEYRADADLLNIFFEKNKIDKSIINFEKVNIVFNSNYRLGMFTSLQSGLKLNNTKHTIYHFVDQPHVPLDFYQKIAKQDFQKYDWFQPKFRERNGHPIIFCNKVKKIILNASENSNLRDVLKNTDIIKGFWECDYPQILDDIDTPKDYQGLC